MQSQEALRVRNQALVLVQAPTIDQPTLEKRIAALDVTKEKFRIPDLSNATIEFLVDELLEAKVLEAEYKKYNGILKERLQAERRKIVADGKPDPGGFNGTEERINFKPMMRITPSVERILAKFKALHNVELSEGELADCSNVTEYEEARKGTKV